MPKESGFWDLLGATVCMCFIQAREENKKHPGVEVFCCLNGFNHVEIVFEDEISFC